MAAPEQAVAPARFMPSLFEPEIEPTEEEKTLHLRDLFMAVKERNDKIHPPPKPKRKRSKTSA